MKTKETFRDRSWRKLALAGVGVLLLSGIVGASALAVEQEPPGPPPPPERMMQRFWDEIDLTDAQKTAIKDIRGQYREQLQSARAKIMETRKALGDLVWNGADEGTVRAKAVEVASAEEELAVVQAAQHAAMRQTLTPEQLTKLDALKAKMDARREEGVRRFHRRWGKRPRGNR